MSQEQECGESMKLVRELSLLNRHGGVSVGDYPGNVAESAIMQVESPGASAIGCWAAASQLWIRIGTTEAGEGSDMGQDDVQGK